MDFSSSLFCCFKLAFILLQCLLCSVFLLTLSVQYLVLQHCGIESWGWGRKLQFSDSQLQISERGDSRCSNFKCFPPKIFRNAYFQPETLYFWKIILRQEPTLSSNRQHYETDDCLEAVSYTHLTLPTNREV